ncbi:MAG: NADPH-dependent oxidoreductase [Sideroxydans sp.]|nr:NADPH-dependent oxidoreductase [Sideroxydans sp.]
MNETIKLQHNHRSIRSYKADPVSDEMLNAIIEAGHRAPSSMNAQEISVVVVRDAERKTKIAELAGGQAWIAQAPVFIAIVADYNKTDIGVRKAGQTQVIHESMEGLIVAGIDAGLVLANMMVAAHSLGLGIVPIGGLRRSPQAIVDLLGLPQLTFPLVGLCIGHIEKDAPLKPRMDVNTFRHDERYDASHYQEAIDNYDATIMEYWKQLGRTDGLSWSQNLGNNLKQVYYPQVKPVAAMQGLLNDK